MKYVILAIVILMIIAGLLYYYVFTGVITIDSQRPLDAAVKIDDKEVTIDMNHPLAGKVLIFKIKVVEILQ